MDLNRIIRELVKERDRIQRIIESVERMKLAGKVRVRAEGKPRRRKSTDRAAPEDDVNAEVRGES
jgi:hypothetical protein